MGCCYDPIMKLPARRTAILVGLITLAACGIKSPPLPPVIRVAETTRDLAVYQEVREAVLGWSYPSSTTAGDPLTELEAIEVWRATFDAVEAPPPAEDARGRDLNRQLLLSGGERIAELDHDALDAATRGSTLEYRDDLEAWRRDHPSDDQVLWYAVRSVCCGGRESTLSNIVRLQPATPPEPPTDLSVEPTGDGIRIGWTATDDLPVLIERSADTESWRAVSPKPVAAGDWVDHAATQGRPWNYRLRSVLERKGAPRVVGAPGSAEGVLYADVYPPAAPTGMVCLPEGTRVRLRWQPVPDAASYLVERVSDQGTTVVLAERQTETGFEDEAPPPGTSTYRVTAADAAGNVSEPATCSAARGGGP